MRFLIFKNRSPYTNEFLLDYNQFLNNYLIYSFPLDRMLKHYSGSNLLLSMENLIIIQVHQLLLFISRLLIQILKLKMGLW